MATGKATYVPAMEITTHQEHDTCILALSGDLDFGSCLLLDEAIKKALQEGVSLKRVYLNCQQLHFISSAGLGVLVEHLHVLQAQKVALILHDMNPVVRDTFSILGLDQYFPIVSSKEEANRFCQSHGC